jgi:hypothetical protein
MRPILHLASLVPQIWERFSGDRNRLERLNTRREGGSRDGKLDGQPRGRGGEHRDPMLGGGAGPKGGGKLGRGCVGEEWRRQSSTGRWRWCSGGEVPEHGHRASRYACGCFALLALCSVHKELHLVQDVKSNKSLIIICVARRRSLLPPPLQPDDGGLLVLALEAAQEVLLGAGHA